MCGKLIKVETVIELTILDKYGKLNKLHPKLSYLKKLHDAYNLLSDFEPDSLEFGDSKD